MYPRRFALCVGDDVVNKYLSICHHGASGKNQKNEGEKKKGRDDRRVPCRRAQSSLPSPPSVLVAIYHSVYLTIIPSSFYEANRKLCDLGLGYETIHVCKYDCVLYLKEFAHLQYCLTCGEARYKEWFADMRWHRDKRVEIDDVLRHPTDAEG
ncbi:uncharacterized protein E5676_scaffold455G001060 [Cucumis melo var. makuwa]|uniref:Transposase n=1 Tax=Cucumis melo var. makuwa TaxID=1194695 RepID=A0A5D3E4A0_CUCMM|nr:uncharacterized protein E5676_scaffold455G001060 [Cucumis melo var. makuwa]